MGNRLDDIFSPLGSEFLKKIEAEALERRKTIRLVKERDTHEESPLYAAEPFGGFVGDCEVCDHYLPSPFAFVTGGDCKKHCRPTGYGFTCKDNTSDDNKDWDEFKRISEE